jgi:hypothetical protein
MAIRRWPKFAPGTSFDVIRVELDAWMRENDARIVGGDRAHTALDSAGTLTTNVSGHATIAGKSAGGISQVWATDFMETFNTLPAEWTVLAGTKNATLTGTGQTGGKAVRQTGPVTLEFPYDSLPYDATKAHRLRATVKRVSGSGTFSFGVRCYAANGSFLAQVPVAADHASPGGVYQTFTGWVQGFGTPSAPAPNADAPTPLPAGTATIRPYYALNEGDATGVTDLDAISYDRLDEEATARLYETLLPSDDPERLATGAGLQPATINEPAMQDDVVSTRVIMADVEIVGKIYSSDDPTIFLDLRTGLAPTDLVFSHPALALYFDGTADFGGTVSAPTFTATLATFSGTVGMEHLSVGQSAVFGSGTPDLIPTKFLQGVEFDGAASPVSPQVQVKNGIWRFNSTSLCWVDGDFAHTGGSLGFFNATPVAQQADPGDTSGADLATNEGRINAILGILRAYGLI